LVDSKPVALRLYPCLETVMPGPFISAPLLQELGCDEH
jgi:hypothetical protein